ncbi:fatty acid desaturase family protein [Desertibaculum subflavum]|uniref:fatty acid desaturase family protein n=1 Tax=Desertibaculum subflavum TaxID=2268458 RepID=UPI000E671E31
MSAGDIGSLGRARRLERAAAWGAIAHIALVAMALFAVPVLLSHGLAWAVLLIPVVLISNSYWAVLHEALHGNLLPGRAANDALGRLLAILFGSALGVLRTAHLGHHGFNRHVHDRPDTFDPGRVPHVIAYARYYWGMLFGLYLGEIAAPLICLLPRRLIDRLIDRAFLPEEPGVAAHARASLFAPGVLPGVRLDGLLALAVFGLAFWLYGENWPLLAAFLVARGFLVGFVDNLYHHGTPLDDRRFAWNLALPRWASLMILHGNLHRQHHQRPTLPWHRLPDAMTKRHDRFDEGFLSASVRQLKGPIEIDRLRRGAAAARSL